MWRRAGLCTHACIMYCCCIFSIAAADDDAQRFRAPPTTSAKLLQWRGQLAKVRSLRTQDRHEASKIIRSGMTRRPDEPSFSRLFTHETWANYIVKEPPLKRWWHNAVTWHYSTVLRAVLPCCLLVAVWSLIVSAIDAFFPAWFKWIRLDVSKPVSKLAFELQGTVIGLLLVFRTNNGYERLAEARMLLGRALCLSREIAQTVACTWPLTPVYEEHSIAYSIAGSMGGEFAVSAGHPGAIGGLPT